MGAGERTGLRGALVRLAFAVQLAVDGVLANRLRSLLALLGVTIGAASVVAMVGVGEGARLAIVRQFESLGANVIRIEVHSPAIFLTADDARELVERVPTLHRAMPVLRARGQVKWRRTVLQDVAILGVDEDFPAIRQHPLAAGRFFSALHVEERTRVAVVGYNLTRTLFGGRNPVGQTITIGPERFKVVGVLTPKGARLGEGIDDQILIPVTAAQRLVGSYRINAVWAQARSREDVDLAVVQISRILRRKFNLALPGEEKQQQGPGGPGAGEVRVPVDRGPWFEEGGAMTLVRPEPPRPAYGSDGRPLPVSVTSLNELMDAATRANRVMTLLLGGIASVSLLVGGLGIMNVMLVAVSERTAEIGLRKAVGARRGDLLAQFVLESLLISLTGAGLGLMLGLLGAGLLGRYGLEAVVTPAAVWVATSVALGVGVVFGAYPAWLASGLQPVEALRRA